MKTIPLTQGKFALIDDSDYLSVSAHTWHAVTGGRSKTFYAARDRATPKGRRPQKLHQFLLGPGEFGLVIDHINGDGLDNRRENLRWISQKENSRNCFKRVPGSSQFKGVCFSKGAGRWESYICPDGKKIYLGLFDSEKEAAERYDQEAARIYGSSARTNFVCKS